MILIVQRPSQAGHNKKYLIREKRNGTNGRVLGGFTTEREAIVFRDNYAGHMVPPVKAENPTPSRTKKDTPAFVKVGDTLAEAGAKCFVYLHRCWELNSEWRKIGSSIDPYARPGGQWCFTEVLGEPIEFENSKEAEEFEREIQDRLTEQGHRIPGTKERFYAHPEVDEIFCD